jgi:hypothetical protein
MIRLLKARAGRQNKTTTMDYTLMTTLSKRMAATAPLSGEGKGLFLTVPAELGALSS